MLSSTLAGNSFLHMSHLMLFWGPGFRTVSCGDGRGLPMSTLRPRPTPIPLVFLMRHTIRPPTQVGTRLGCYTVVPSMGQRGGLPQTKDKRPLVSLLSYSETISDSSSDSSDIHYSIFSDSDIHRGLISHCNRNKLSLVTFILKDFIFQFLTCCTLVYS